LKNKVLLLIVFLAALLRFSRLGQVPVSLYWDEASLGYNAYSILRTAHDEHGNFMPITNFGAFGDYKPPLYIYAAVPSIALFGLTETAVRFPSAFAGTLTVLLAYWLAKRILQNGDLSPDKAEKLSLLACFFLAISPWHIQMSRAAFEANLGLFFSTLGTLAFFKFSEEKPIYLFISATSFIAAMYTFTGQRLFVPIIAVALIIQFKKAILENLKWATGTTIISLVILWPLFNFGKTIEGRLRFDEVTIFKNLDPINKSIEYRQKDNFSKISGIIHNRRLFFAQDYLTHYMDAFSPSFLFTKGDANPRISTQEVGELYYLDLILFPAGLYFLFSKRYKYRTFIVAWLLISPLGPATARETPHALRMVHILPTFQLIGAVGLFHLLQNLKRKKVFLTTILLVIILQAAYYLHIYYVNWPKTYSSEWQYGYKQAVKLVSQNMQDVDHVFVTDSLGRPYIYFLLYNQFDPKAFQVNAYVVKDQFFFYHVLGFEKFSFGPTESSPILPHSLYVTAPNQQPDKAKKITTIYNLSGDKVFDISKTE
jgi:4-amino-4-deoxy-L-arabinose transferase-like glycosyltransferase